MHMKVHAQMMVQIDCYVELTELLTKEHGGEVGWEGEGGEVGWEVRVVRWGGKVRVVRWGGR